MKQVHENPHMTCSLSVKSFTQSSFNASNVEEQNGRTSIIRATLFCRIWGSCIRAKFPLSPQIIQGTVRWVVL